MTKEQELAEFLKVLDEYASKVSINKFQNEKNIDEILLSTEEERLMWSDEVLENKAFILFGYCGYLQRCINQQQIKLKWANSNLRVLYGRESSKYDRWSYQERQDAILADQQPALVLHQIILNAETRIAQLDHMTQFIREMSHCLKDLAKSKRSIRYERT